MAGVVECPSCGKKNRVPVVSTGIPHCAHCHADLPWLVTAGEADFDRAVGTSLPVLIDLWAPWCGPCRTLAPGIEEASRTLAGRLKVVKVNVDEAPEISARFGVQGIPTLLILRQGKPVARQVGAVPTAQLMAWIRQTVDTGAAGAG